MVQNVGRWSGAPAPSTTSWAHLGLWSLPVWELIEWDLLFSFDLHFFLYLIEAMVSREHSLTVFF